MEGVLKQWGWLIKILGICLFSYFLAKITNVYVGGLLNVKRPIGVVSSTAATGKARQHPSRSEFDVVVERNIFDSKDVAAEPGQEGAEGSSVAAVPTGEAVKTSLPVKVMAVMVIGEGKDNRSSTTIESGGKTDAYAVGNDMVIASNAKLVQVKPGRIEFVNSGRLEYAELDMGLGDSIFGPPKATLASGELAPKAKDKEPEVKKAGEGKFVIDQKEIDNALANPETLYTEIRAVPNFENGKVSGMKVLSIKPGSLFSKLGLKRGDILQQINGLDLDVKQGFTIFSQLKDQKSFNLNLQRDGAKSTLEYEIR